MSTDTSTSLEMTRLIKANADTVYRAWTEPDQMKRWSCPAYATIESAGLHMGLGAGGAQGRGAHGDRAVQRDGRIHRSGRGP